MLIELKFIFVYTKSVITHSLIQYVIFVWFKLTMPTKFHSKYDKCAYSFSFLYEQPT